MQAEKTPIICAACGMPIVKAVDQAGEFCSIACLRTGRSFCKQCGKPLNGPEHGYGVFKKSYCSELCRRRAAFGLESVHQSYIAERNRSTCKCCNKPITQPKNGIRQFCSRTCTRRYHATERRGQNPSHEWGNYPPETRRALLDVQLYMGKVAATRMAIAIDREYILRNRHQQGMVGPFSLFWCKTCGKEFRRRPWGIQSKEYCSSTCRPKKPFNSEAATHGKLTWEQVDEIRRLYVTELLSSSQLAARYGVSAAAIQHIIRKKTWKPENDPRLSTYIPKRKFLNTPRKFTWEMVDEMRALYASGQVTYREIGEKYGITSSATVHNIINGISYKPEYDPRRKASE